MATVGVKGLHNAGYVAGGLVWCALELLAADAHLLVVWVVRRWSTSVGRRRCRWRRVELVHGTALWAFRDDHFTACRQQLLQRQVLLWTHPVLMRKLHGEADDEATTVESPAILRHSFVHDVSYITRLDYLAYDANNQDVLLVLELLIRWMDRWLGFNGILST